MSKNQGESSHQPYPNFSSSATNIVIDDFISSGSTISSILDIIEKAQLKPNTLIVMSNAQRFIERGIFNTVISSD